MKKILLVGSVACGKTTLCQRINGMEQVYKKTQALEVINQTIDTPGEYLEHRSLLRALVVTSVDVEQVLFVLDPTQDRYMFSPGQATAFPVPVAGVITKADLSSEIQTLQAKELLGLAGAHPIFTVSSYTGVGISDLINFLSANEVHL